MRIFLVSALYCGAAWAQTTSDLMPAPPPPPPGGGSVYYPGMPVPQPEAPRESAPKGGKGESRERIGLILNDDYTVDEPDEPEVQVEAQNGTHVVRRGDTLWGVSATYFHNPWYWPKLWAFNPAITNPHWIYPGDIIRLSAGGPASPVETKPEQSNEPPPRKLTGRVLAPAGLFLRQIGFVEPDELESSGKVVGSKEEKIMLATLDEAYVEYSGKSPLVVGEKYSVYKPSRTVKHPVTGKRVGEIVEILGEVQVKAITDGKIARVLILDSYEAIERGARVGPLRRTFKMVDHTPAAQDMAALIVTTMRPIVLLGTEMLVFIDRGAKDGVQLGNQFQIVRRGDGYEPLLWHGGPIEDKRFPREVVGTVQVVDLRDHLATGWVIHSTKEARIGDRVELRQGE